MALSRALAALLVLRPLAVLAGVHEVWWNITYVDNVNPDGLFPRRVVGVNNTWPPPPLDVSTNDTLVVHAFNSLDSPTSLHHHGMFFNATSWYDGAVGITQCGIPPGQEFTYVVPVNSSGQSGTYWVHAHASGQYVDGLRAPLVLHPEKEVFNYDEEFTVVLGDWYHDQHSDLIKQFLSIANPGGAEPVPDSGLIYFAQNATYLPGFNENATLNFVPGKTYRLRIVNTSAFAAFFFWIDGHQMRVIEVDGTDVEEYPSDVLSLSVAQRYSVLVTALNDTTSNWAIHGNMDTDMFDTVPDTLQPNITSSITYNTSAPLTSNDLPTFTSNTSLETTYPPTGITETLLSPIPAEAQIKPANKTLTLLVAFDTLTDGTNRAMFNSITFNTPLVPSILSALTLNGTQTNPDGSQSPFYDVAEAYGPNAFVFEYGDIVDLVVQNSDAGKHPFHLHGHKFQIVNRALDYTAPLNTSLPTDPTDPNSPLAILNPPLEEGQTNPIRRDTLQIPSMGSATLRFEITNPGAWFFHCHIEWHLEAGLAISIISAPAQIQSSLSSFTDSLADLSKPVLPFSTLQSQCASQNLPSSGNAAGHESTTDLSRLTFGPFVQNLGWHSRGIGAMAGCVLTAVLGMLTVVWYSAFGARMTEEDVEEDVKRKIERGGKVQRIKGLFVKK